MRSAFSLLAGAMLLGGVTGCEQLSGLNSLEVDDGDASIELLPDGAPAPRDGALPPTDGAPAPGDARAGDSGPTEDAEPGRDAIADVSSSDAPTDAPADASPLSCASTRGPTMVSVGSFCIDSTEVTNDQYATFLASSPALSLAPSPACSFKSSFTPSTTVNNKGTNPVVYVDWCDAYAYCAWAGKHLCGAIGGGPSSKANSANKNVDEWYVACSQDGANVYPYGGNVYTQGKCNDYESGTHGTRPVASFAGCQGGYSGIWDMNGNAYEWEDACDVSAGASDSCVIRGGSWNFTGAGYGGCNTYFNDYVVKRSDTYNDTGFRCCKG